mmetsp:Transcript_15612/g.62861  ORF Transcript_15612/g.62861 Transcript_15612/m.62861 type:complete len:350 (+) Transcript_15612:847-1896(+)
MMMMMMMIWRNRCVLITQACSRDARLRHGAGVPVDAVPEVLSAAARARVRRRARVHGARRARRVAAQVRGQVPALDARVVAVGRGVARGARGVLRALLRAALRVGARGRVAGRRGRQGRRDGRRRRLLSGLLLLPLAQLRRRQVRRRLAPRRLGDVPPQRGRLPRAAGQRLLQRRGPLALPPQRRPQLPDRAPPLPARRARPLPDHRAHRQELRRNALRGTLRLRPLRHRRAEPRLGLRLPRQDGQPSKHAALAETRLTTHAPRRVFVVHSTEKVVPRRLSLLLLLRASFSAVLQRQLLGAPPRPLHPCVPRARVDCALPGVVGCLLHFDSLPLRLRHMFNVLSESDAA